MQSLLSITDLHIAVAGKEVVRGVSLAINEGEIHAVMGPNGSGKSTLVSTLMGHPAYEVVSGAAMFRGKDLFAMEPWERAQAGLFLAFQYPKEIAGVTLRSFLFAAAKAQATARGQGHPPSSAGADYGGAGGQGKVLSPIKFKKLLEEKMKELHMDPAFAERSLNKGFSGGEKKKAEILQMSILQPRLALLDETDSGLDIDALKIVAEGVNRMRLTTAKSASADEAGFSALLVTHYARLLHYIKPDHVHVMVSGKIVESGGPDLAEKLEREGYAAYGEKIEN